jgi:hypothetical protein
LAKLNSPELSVEAGETLPIPLIITNPLDLPIQVQIKAEIPAGWTLVSVPSSATIQPKARYYFRVRAIAPAKKIDGWHSFSISANTLDGKSLGKLTMRVEMNDWALPL